MLACYWLQITTTALYSSIKIGSRADLSTIGQGREPVEETPTDSHQITPSQYEYNGVPPSSFECPLSNKKHHEPKNKRIIPAIRLAMRSKAQFSLSSA